MNWSDYIFKSTKGWEGREAFWVWQIQSLKTPHEFLRVKKFLVVDARPQSAGVRIENEKPEGLKGSGSLQGMLRKYAKAPAIGQIVQSDQHIWIPLYVDAGKPPGFWMVIAKKKPPELAFLNSDHECLLKRGNAGTFTKKHPYDIPRPNDGVSLSKGLVEQATTLADDETDDNLRALSNPHTAEHAQSAAPLLPDYQRQARDKLARRLKTVRKSLAKLKEGIPGGEDLQLAERNARLLQQFLYKVSYGDFEVVLLPEETGLEEVVRITLDPDSSAGKNLETAFIAIKKARRARETGISRLQAVEQHVGEISEDLETLRSTPLLEHHVQAILARHKISGSHTTRRKLTAPVSLPYRHYRLPEGFDVLVGKSAKDNDEMTKRAKSNDLWLHIVGPPGSHVILQTKGNPNVPPAVVAKAAMLAIHFSKFRSDMAGEVYVTAKANVKKKKGLPPGKWIVESAETTFLRYTEDELKPVLDFLIT